MVGCWPMHRKQPAAENSFFCDFPGFLASEEKRWQKLSLPRFLIKRPQNY